MVNNSGYLRAIDLICLQLFGEAVLGLSQGSVSELLSKPKPWHMLSIKGREPFIRMQLWLADHHNLDKLQHLKNERREASKRRRTLDPSHELNMDSSGDYQSSSPEGTSKKARVLFSDEQREAMHIAYALDAYPSLPTIEFLSKELQLSPRTITNWFHNHRMRLKQMPPSPSDRPRDSTNPPLDPLHFRILLSQRLMEIRQEKGLPQSDFLNPLRTIQDLNLSVKTEHDPEDSVNSVVDEDSNLSNDISSPVNNEVDDDVDDDRSISPSGRSISRRKPVLPQWVNPDWQAINGSDSSKQMIINGVCVMQTDGIQSGELPASLGYESSTIFNENRRSPSSTSPRTSSPIEDQKVSKTIMNNSNSLNASDCDSALRSSPQSLENVSDKMSIPETIDTEA